MNLEKIILTNLIKNDDYVKKVLPFLKSSYFTDPHEKRIFREIKDHILTYNKSPEYSTLKIQLQQKKGLDEKGLVNCNNILDNINKESKTTDTDWLINSTEEFCRQKAIYLAMVESMDILNGSAKGKAPGVIPQILSDALSISFDPSVGHDYFEDAEEQYEYYHKPENKIEFGLDILNEITNGGLPEKTLTVLMGGVGVGKTMSMCSLAADYLARGYDVLYITLEMSQGEIVKRIDANLLNCPLDDLDKLPKMDYNNKISKLMKSTNGKLIVKEYPTGEANVLHFQALMDDLKLKKNFKPQAVFIDYINLCSSSRLKPGVAGMYGYIKAIAEEVRGFSVRNSTRVITATQMNREGFKSSDPDMTNVAESFGLPATADLMLSLYMNEELEKLCQIMMIQLKNRFGNLAMKRRFVVGVDKSKQRLYNLDNSAQDGIIDLNSGEMVQTKKKDDYGKFFDDWKF